MGVTTHCDPNCHPIYSSWPVISMIDLFELLSLAVSMKLPWLFELFSLTVNPSNDYPVHCVWISPVLQPTNHFSPMLYIPVKLVTHRTIPTAFGDTLPWIYLVSEPDPSQEEGSGSKQRKGLVPSLGYILQ